MLYTTINIPGFFKDVSHQKYSYSKKLEVVRELAKTYDAEIIDDSSNSFSADRQNNLLTKTVLLDSTIIGTEAEEDKYYVKVNIGRKSSSRVFAKLQCEESLYKTIREFTFKEALIVADLDQITISDSLHYVFKEDEEILADVGPDILLTGTCLDAIELAAF